MSSESPLSLEDLITQLQIKRDFISNALTNSVQAHSTHRAILIKRIHRAYRAYCTLYAQLQTEKRDYLEAKENSRKISSSNTLRLLQTLDQIEEQHPLVFEIYMSYFPPQVHPPKKQKYQDRSPIQQELLFQNLS